MAGLIGGLRSIGHEVEQIRPRRARSAKLAARIAFNLRLRSLLRRRAPFDLIVGIDLDGCFLGHTRTHAGGGRPGGVGQPTRRARRIVALKGVAADERRFERGPTRLRMGILASLEAQNARGAHAVVVPSEYSRRVAVETYGLDPARVHVAPEGIDLASWPPGPAPRNLEERECESDRPPRRILNVARQYPRKDTRTLIEAMPAVRRAVPGARLHIVGGGPELPALRRQAAALGLDDDAVCVLGGVTAAHEIRQQYLDADVFCLPSRQEGFGIVLLEAMAAGVPIVAAAAGAIPEVAPHGEAAVLVPPGDSGALAAALVRVLEDDRLRARLGRQGLERVRAYDWPLSAARFLDAAGADCCSGG